MRFLQKLTARLVENPPNLQFGLDWSKYLDEKIEMSIACLSTKARLRGQGLLLLTFNMDDLNRLLHGSLPLLLRGKG